MKKFAIVLLATIPIFGAGSVGQSINPLGPQAPPSGLPDNRTYVMSISWIGDSVNGTVPSTVINIASVPQVQGMRLIQIEVQPGTPSPTAGYGITLADSSGVDLLQGQGANLSATNAFFTGSIVSPPLLNSPTFALSGNSVASARGTVALYFVPLSTATPTVSGASLTTNNTFTGNTTFNGTASFASGNLLPSVAGGTDLGSTALPFGNAWLGTAATNNFKLAPASTTAARVISIPDPGVNTNLALNLTATSAAFATATTAGTCVQQVTAVTGAATTMAVSVSPVSTPGVGAVWSGFVSSAGNVTINECAVATSAGGTIAFNIRVTP